MEVKIYHNPRCSKSRQALELLENKGINPTVKKYLDEGLTIDEIMELSGLLKKDIIDFVRTKEEAYKALGIDWNNNDAAAKALSKNPKILERPIVINGKKAIVARPPELIEDLF